jgi:hypothetical protein
MIPFVRELAAICEADAAEYEDHDPEDLALLENMVKPGKEPMHVVYQALSEHKAMSRYLADRPTAVQDLKALARRLRASR